jgi:gamma-glutamyl:cysteine ligase YbdK (ATP-grasp superfamily)
VAEFEALYGSLVRAKSITSIKDFWWDIRPHPDFGTIELRFCDALPTLRETIALVALAHCLAGRLVEQYEDGLRMSPPPMWMIRENKWRASRLGMRASFVVREDGETERPPTPRGGWSRSSPRRPEARLCEGAARRARDREGGQRRRAPARRVRAA